MKRLVMATALAATAGCASEQPSNFFTLTADLPPDFSYTAKVSYVPAPGQTCTVSKLDNLKPVFNREWWNNYEPHSRIEIRRVRKGCELVVRSIALEINASYGADWSHIGGSNALIAVRENLAAQSKGTFNAEGESTFTGQCEWWFRTIGPQRYIAKILDCRKTSAKGEIVPGRPSAAYSLDQLPGKRVVLKIALAPDETPYYAGWWLKTSAGWKPCTGLWGTSNEERCTTPPSFIDFRMPDGTVCTVYPNCHE